MSTPISPGRFSLVRMPPRSGANARVRASRHHRTVTDGILGGVLSRLLLVLALVLTPGVALAAPLQDQQRPTDPRYGISPGADILWLPEAELMQELDLYQSMGFGWIRLDFDWHSIQDRRGRYSWTATDRVVQAARERGLRVLAMPAYTPRWAAVVDDPHSRPADMSAFARFVGAAVKRYRPLGIHDWEIWNEPNSRLFWLPRPDARAYARMLALTSRRIRVNDPEATIIAGALAPASTARNGSQISPIDFLRELYCQGPLSSAQWRT